MSVSLKYGKGGNKMSFFGKFSGRETIKEPTPDQVKQISKRLLSMLNDDAKQNKLIPSQYLQPNPLDENLARSIDFGHVPDKPIQVNGPLGEMTYLSRLVVKNTGSSVFFHRLGSFIAMPNGNITAIDVYETVSWDGKTWDILYFNCYHRAKTKATPPQYTFAERVEGMNGINTKLVSFPDGIYEATLRSAKNITGSPCANPKMRDIQTAAWQRPPEFVEALQMVKSKLGASTINGADL
jgi:hypothetical protein